MPDVPVVAIRSHEDYRKACERIGRLECDRPNAARDLELFFLSALVFDFDPREVADSGVLIPAKDATADARVSERGPQADHLPRCDAFSLDLVLACKGPATS